MAIGWNYSNTKPKGRIMAASVDIMNRRVFVEVVRGDLSNSRCYYALQYTPQGRRLLQRGRKLQDMIMNREVS